MNAKKLKKKEIESKMEKVSIECTKEIEKQIKDNRNLRQKRLSLYKQCAKNKINNHGIFRKFLHEMKD